MKFTYKDKVEMYRLWKEEHYSSKRLAAQFQCNRTVATYIVKLIDIHGLSVVRKNKNKKYSAKFKKEAIRRVLINHECAIQVSLSLALPGCGTLLSWIKSYIENGYNVIERKRGCYGQKESAEDRIIRRADEEDTGASEASEAEHEAIDRKRILKKLDALISEREKREQKK